MQRIAELVLLLTLIPIAACSASVGEPAESKPSVSDVVTPQMPSGYEYVDDYVTTDSGDKVWVVEVTEKDCTIDPQQVAALFRDLAEAIETKHVAFLELSVISSDEWIPYSYRVRAGHARAAARGDITRKDLAIHILQESE